MGRARNKNLVCWIGEWLGRFFWGYDQKIFVNPMMKGKMLGRSISFLTNNRFGFKQV